MLSLRDIEDYAEIMEQLKASATRKPEETKKSPTFLVFLRRKKAQ